MDLYKEAQDIAREALENAEGCFDTAYDYLHETVDGHQVAFYYGQAIQFCSENDTSDDEQLARRFVAAIAQEGAVCQQIACRVAYRSLLCRSQDALQEFQEEMEQIMMKQIERFNTKTVSCCSYVRQQTCWSIWINLTAYVSGEWRQTLCLKLPS